MLLLWDRQFGEIFCDLILKEIRWIIFQYCRNFLAECMFTPNNSLGSNTVFVFLFFSDGNRKFRRYLARRYARTFRLFISVFTI